MGSAEQKRWIIYAFAMGCSGHQSPGLYSLPEDKSVFHNKLSYWTDLAKLLEKGKLDGVFLADVLGGYDVYKGSLDPALSSGAQYPIIDPLMTISGMAAVTKNLSFGITATTSYEHPYSLARRFSTLDHLTNGRVGWNVVTGYLDSAARQFGAKNQDLHAKRYDVAHEYMDVVYKLWESSWADDAVKHDISKPLYTQPDRVRAVNHKGTYFPSVPGPHICEPSLQRTPVIFQAGSSGPGLAFAGRHAEVAFIAAHRPDVARSRVDAMRKAAKEAGRDAHAIQVLALLCPIIAKTDEEAQERHDYLFKHGSDDGALALFGGWTGIDLGPYGDDEELRNLPEGNAIKSAVEGFARQDPSVQKWTKREVANLIKLGGLGPIVVGSAQTVADKLEAWVEEAGVDGFNLAYAAFPTTFIEVVELLIPELQKRGHAWLDYAKPGKKPSDWPSNKKTQGGVPGYGEDEVLGLTTREKLYGAGQRRLLDDHYGAKFRWHAGQPAPELD